jgi:TP901 family phage tail tape measure protein
MAKYTIPTVYKAIDKFSAPVNKMTRTAETSFARLERRVRKVGDASMRMAKKSLMVGAAIAVPLIAAANEAVKFEAKMSNISTLVDTNVENMEQMSNRVLDLATKLPVPVEDLATALYDIRSAGIEASKAMNTLNVSAKLGVAGIGTTQEATDVLTSSLNAFASQGLSAEQTANILFKTVKAGKTTITEFSQSFGQAAPTIAAAGISLQDFSAATAALTTVGTPASVAQNRLAMAIAKLNKPTAQMEKVFKKLGVSSGKELIANSENLVDVFTKIENVAAKNNISVTKAWGSNEAYSASVALMGAQNKAYVTTLADMNKGTDSLTGAFEKQNSTSKANLQVLKNNLQVVAIKIGTALLPVVTELAKSMLPVIQGIANWVSRNPALVSSIAKLAVKAVLLSGAIAAIGFTIGIMAKAMKIARAVQTGYNVVMGVTAALSGTAAISIGKNAAALGGYTATLKAATMAKILFNAIKSPWGIAIVSIVAVTAIIYKLTRSYSILTQSQRLNGEVNRRMMSNTIDQRVELSVLFKTLKKAKEGSVAYGDALKNLDRIQPGIIDKYDLTRKSLDRLNLAEKESIKLILQKGRTQAIGELITEKLKKAEEERGKIGKRRSTNTGNIAQNTINASTNKIRMAKINRVNRLEDDADKLANKLVTRKDDPTDVKKTGMLAGMGRATISPVSKTLDTKETTNTEKQDITITVNAPEGTTASSKGSNLVKTTISN